MSTKKVLAVGLILVSAFLRSFGSDEQLSESWKQWLAEVAPIMSRAEAGVFKALGTEEDRKRFQKLFWQVRDPIPGTSQNEFMTEYYERLRYAKNRLGGATSDRSRIYLLLGKPGEVQTFTSSDSVVDCELWIYQGTGRPGLPPLLYLLFYKRDNIGNFELFYPGMNSPLEILSTSYARGAVSRSKAVKLIRQSYPELAKATLSIIPDEADVNFIGGSNSSATVIAQVFSLPDREVEKKYLQNFGTAQGSVDVSYTTREIAGKAALAITEHMGLRFLSYSLMPDVIRTVRNRENFDTAHLLLNIRVEDGAGRTVCQQEKEVNLKLDEVRKKAAETNKLVFNDSVPIIEGRFNVNLTFSNKTTEEFFVHKEEITVAGDGPPAVFGYKIKELPPDVFSPLSLGRYKVLSDPRSLYGPGDSLEGLVLSGETPEFRLFPRDGGGPSVEIKDVTREDGLILFRQPLEGFKPGNYDLVIRRDGKEVFRKVLSVLSFKVEKPIEFERTESPSARDSLLFSLGQEYLNTGETDKALEVFRKLPKSLWNAGTLPTIARAFYLKEDYARVVELLEPKDVAKTYPVLLLLGNASLELKKLDRAAEYFEMIRKYGDTAESNKVLGAIYFSLGDKEKAQVYWDRAKSLERKPDENKDNEESK